ncbi:nucleotidyltransferase family protein [Nocardioides houyundeii]|uniref:nucleotidyltransferase family protein n=1 Tax=Nocardioides houyundeii TaxID=2045452 RepID=UPI000DF1D439|nr:NTP transferase domain-containing protein [Nocardioides houyundeii]
MLTGLILAAGAGRRYGQPKVLVRDPGGVPLVHHAIHALVLGGCDHLVVVLGAAAAEARTLVARCAVNGSIVESVIAEDWDTGQSASLRAGLAAAAGTAAQAAVVTLVDLPDVSAAVVQRMTARIGPDSLARAVYDGNAGHPVVLGRAHWGAIRSSSVGDAGARGYLATHQVLSVECGDLATGMDIDRPEDFPSSRR